MRVKEHRLARGWSQAQLAELSGLSVRTIQRIENGANPGLETLRSLAAVFEVDVADLHAELAEGRMSFGAAVRHCLRHYDDFEGLAGKAEFWWFTLAVTLAISLSTTVGPWLATAVATVALLPWLAVGARRLRDAGQSPWWLLIGLAPVGGLVVIAWLAAMPSTGEADNQNTRNPVSPSGARG